MYSLVEPFFGEVNKTYYINLCHIIVSYIVLHEHVLSYVINIPLVDVTSRRQIVVVPERPIRVNPISGNAITAQLPRSILVSTLLNFGDIG